MFSTLFTGLVIGISVAAPVGPTSIELIRRGLRSGFRPAFLLGLGAATSDVLYLILAVLGIAPLLTKFPAVKLVMWILGFAVLGYLGWSGIRDFRRSAGPAINSDTPRPADRNSYLTGLAMTLTNPMGIALWLSVAGGVLATMTSTGSVTSGTTVYLVLGVATGGVTWFTFLAYLSSLGRQYLNPGSFRYIAGAAGVILLFFALRFGYRAGVEIVGMLR